MPAPFCIQKQKADGFHLPLFYQIFEILKVNE